MATHPLPLLMSAAALRERIGNPRLAVFDCRFSLKDTEAGRHAYAAGHLPGAIYAHLDERLSGPVRTGTGRHPLPEPALLAGWLGASGVGNDTDVVVYDDLGGAFAVRLWWLLRWLGHHRVAVLDGGIGAWQAGGGALTTMVPEPTPAILSAKPDDSLWITTDALAAALPTGAVQVIDARAPERYRGEQEPIDPVGGHIPGAINLPFTENLGPDGRFLPAVVLRRRFDDALGSIPPTRLAHSCGSGVNACHNLLAMELAGLAGSRLYAGSWSEWIRSPDRPITRGARG
ncbi:MAG: sulfurtransferase [Thiohalocapsa sp.]|uniref:sulfurtransferase n=1 Tax=Thiohalocapsa sp. TaxID=2497641 RepID=UPI0025D4A5EA|nr:sulfurtransferase [Thiohalocapsa sp.]MCG6941851.1 sulfurtransferase [Thiohalocapsa sp.]